MKGAAATETGGIYQLQTSVGGELLSDPGGCMVHDDVLIDDAGSDTVEGGTGNDIYVVEYVVEAGSGTI